jgi:hypothetical protein
VFEILNGFTDKELLKMLAEHYQLFALEYADEDTLYAEYDFRSAVLSILQTRLQQEHDKRNAELGN